MRECFSVSRASNDYTSARLCVLPGSFNYTVANIDVIDVILRAINAGLCVSRVIVNVSRVIKGATLVINAFLCSFS